MSDPRHHSIDTSDEALYRRLLAGDVAALEALVPRYHGPLLAFLFRLTGDRQQAEDLVQETFTRIVTYRGEPPTRFRPWAFTVARNIALDHLRTAARRQAIAPRVTPSADDDPFITVPDPDPGALDLVLRDDDRRTVAAALQQLPPHQRETVVLRFYHDLSLNEIAEVTGVTVGTVKSRLFHGLRRLKTLLIDEYRAPNGAAPPPSPGTPRPQHRKHAEGGMAHDTAAPVRPGQRSLA